MRKKIIIFVIIILGLITGYLFLAHHYIYWKIGQASLPASDLTHSYLLYNGANYHNALVYSALGDSLTAGVGVDNYSDSYPYLLSRRLAGVDNQIALKVSAYPGARTSDIVKDLLPLAIAQNPDIVTVLAGINDVHGNVSTRVFTGNYRHILNRLTGETKAKIYLISMPYIGSDSLLLAPYNYYFRFREKEFNKIIKQLSVEYKVNYVDLASPTEEILQKNGPVYAADWFHPAKSGYESWANIIYDDIGK